MNHRLKHACPLLGLAALLATTSAQARGCLGVDFPEQLPFDGNALVLNGLGLREATLFKVNVYVAGLYLPRASADPTSILAARAPYVMRLHFVRGVSAADIAKGWSEGFERNAASGIPATDARVATLRSWMGDLTSGQEIRLAFRPGAGVEVIVSGASKGTIPGDDFGRALLSVWLAVPPNPEIKSGLLGGKCD